MPFCKSHNISVSAVLTDNGRECCGTDRHPYELSLELNDIEQRRTHVRSPQTNGFLKRFQRTALDEFYRIAFRRKIYLELKDLQENLDELLTRYNHHRPHLSYRNEGRTPFETLKRYLQENKTET